MRRNLRNRVVLPELDSGEVTFLSQEEVRVVLRAAEGVIATGGRNMLTKILKGTQSEDVMKLGHLENPSFGAFRDLTLKMIGQRVDFVILKGYLDVSSNGRLPVIVLRRKGLHISESIFSREWFDQCEEMVRSGGPYEMEFLKGTNRRTVSRLLDLILKKGDARWLPLLNAWQAVDFKKVRSLIERVKGPLLDEGGRAAVFSKCVVDESFSPNRLERFESYAQKEGIEIEFYELVHTENAGMQDVEILNKLMDEKSVLLSCDRALHNAALERRQRSVYYDPNNWGFVSDFLEGVSPRGILRSDVEPAPVAEGDGAKALSALYPVLAPKDAGAQKKLRTRRRRVHNYFGGVDQMMALAVTLSAVKVKGGELLAGMRLRISARASGLKALDASERYLQIPGEDSVFGHCLAQLILLRLEKVPCQIYYDVPALSVPEGDAAYERLAEEFEGIEFVAAPKGALVERLRAKLLDLSRSKTNEIVRVELPNLEI